MTEDPTQLEDSTIAYNHTSNGGSGDRTNNAQVGRITIKPPTSYRSNPQVWFRQLESQFALANITHLTEVAVIAQTMLKWGE